MGGTGYEEVRRFYEHQFIPEWPSDVEVIRISRTWGTFSLQGSNSSSRARPGPP